MVKIKWKLIIFPAVETSCRWHWFNEVLKFALFVSVDKLSIFLKRGWFSIYCPMLTLGMGNESKLNQHLIFQSMQFIYLKKENHKINFLLQGVNFNFVSKFVFHLLLVTTYTSSQYGHWLFFFKNCTQCNPLSFVVLQKINPIT